MIQSDWRDFITIFVLVCDKFQEFELHCRALTEKFNRVFHFRPRSENNFRFNDVLKVACFRVGILAKIPN